MHHVFFFLSLWTTLDNALFHIWGIQINVDNCSRVLFEHKSSSWSQWGLSQLLGGSKWTECSRTFSNFDYLKLNPLEDVSWLTTKVEVWQHKWNWGNKGTKRSRTLSGHVNRFFTLCTFFNWHFYAFFPGCFFLIFSLYMLWFSTVVCWTTFHLRLLLFPWVLLQLALDKGGTGTCGAILQVYLFF